jgi:hypothetical protein
MMPNFMAKLRQLIASSIALMAEKRGPDAFGQRRIESNVNQASS